MMDYHDNHFSYTPAYAIYTDNENAISAYSATTMTDMPALPMEEIIYLKPGHSTIALVSWSVLFFVLGVVVGMALLLTLV